VGKFWVRFGNGRVFREENPRSVTRAEYSRGRCRLTHRNLDPNQWHRVDLINRAEIFQRAPFT